MGLIAFPAFRPRPPWLGPDLQTLRNFLLRPEFDLSPWPARAVEFAMRDGSGDRLIGLLHGPAAADNSRPLVVLIHGLTGSAQSTYILASARHLLDLGYSVLRLNLRGAGASQQSCRQRYHAGRSADLRDVIAGLPPELVGGGALAVGYSLGANVLLKLLGEDGRAPAGRRTPLRAAAAISAPIALASGCVRLMSLRNRPYHAYLLARMKEEALHRDAALDARQRAAISTARSVHEFDDRVVGPVNGFSGADEYYALNSSAQFLGDITTPTLIVHAFDDPWIPGADYAAFDWSSNPNLTPLLPMSGGHAGFHGVGSLIPWHDHCVAKFFTAIIDHHEDVNQLHLNQFIT